MTDQHLSFVQGFLSSAVGFPIICMEIGIKSQKYLSDIHY